MKIKEKVIENKKWLIYSFTIFMLVHASKFIINYPCWDTSGNILSSYSNMRTSGRWFYGIAKIMLSSRYDLQWVEGIIAGILVSFSTVIMMELLQIKSVQTRITLSILVAAFPSMAATFVYQFCAPAYMLALFLAILSVYLVEKNMTVWSAVMAAICLAVSLGCYQIYYFVAICMFLYTIFSKLVNGQNLADCKKMILYYFSAWVGGIIIYKIIDVILQKIFNYTLSTYQGINGVGNITWNSILAGIKNIKNELQRFYFLFSNGSFYANFEKLLTILLVANIIIFILLNKNLAHIQRAVLLGIMAVCLPITYSLYLVTSGDVHYHNLMVFGNIFIYLSILILYETKNISFGKMGGCNNVKYYISALSVMAVFILGCYHAINTNIIYKEMEQSAEITRFQTIEILTKIDELSEIDEEKIAVIGNYQTFAQKIQAYPDTIGIAYDYLSGSTALIDYSKYYYARSFEFCDDDTIENIKASEEFKDMSCYPKGEYVKKINGVIVVKLSEQ